MKKITITLFSVFFLYLLTTLPARAVKHVIMQQGLTFSPAVLENVIVGDTIRWVWTSGFHTTTSSEIPSGAEAWDAILSSSSQVFEYAVQIPGEYLYVCTPHEIMGMVGSFTASPGGSTIQGVLSYANGLSSGMSNSGIRLKDLGDNLIDEANTDMNGSFQFTEVMDGTYILESYTTLPWGGVNATDAFAILKHFVNMTPLTGYKLNAADVDNSGFINAIDALSASKRFVGQISSFPAGDWYLTTVQVVVSGSATYPVNLKGICYGDADGSYSP
ncbi:MAG TPA: dockerin type I domain-containing protein [Bacteroidales bacterium]|nr:dockerin type I domain-containing protein [Bacteroidales bacterium]HSA42751.1 dockerin type I domain-containing protein [Bacteroidales bacterium]